MHDYQGFTRLAEFIKDQNIICNKGEEGLPQAKMMATNGLLMDLWAVPFPANPPNP